MDGEGGELMEESLGYPRSLVGVFWWAPTSRTDMHNAVLVITIIINSPPKPRATTTTEMGESVGGGGGEGVGYF